MALDHLVRAGPSGVQFFKNALRILDFPDGPVLKNLPADTGDTGSIPGPGRSHVLWGNGLCEPQLQSPRALPERRR